MTTSAVMGAGWGQGGHHQELHHPWGSIETTAGHGGAVVSGNRSFVWMVAAARRWQDTRISEEVF